MKPTDNGNVVLDELLDTARSNYSKLPKEELLNKLRKASIPPKVEPFLLSIKCLCPDNHNDGKMENHEVIDQKEGTRRYYRTPDKPFKPFGIFTFGYDEKATIDSLSIGNCEQLVSPVPTSCFLCPIDKDLLFTMWIMGNPFEYIPNVQRLKLPIIEPGRPLTVQITGTLHDLIFWGVQRK
jgi:hypothetical protein